jgi:glycosyltransferase involved in cell wall biosynthesis
MSFARPLVATRVGGIPELVRHGETGFLVDRDDVPAMAARILDLLRDDALRARMGQAGRRVVEETFDLARTMGRYLEILGIDTPPAVKDSKGQSAWTQSFGMTLLK